MDNKERIEELKAEIARLEKEDEFRPFLAWVSCDNERPDNKCRMALIVSKQDTEYFPFIDNMYLGWKYATPLTRKEILSYLPPQKAGYDWDDILREYPDTKAAARHPNGNIILSTHSRIMAYDDHFINVSNDGSFFYSEHRPEWILDKDCNWKDSIEHKEDVR